MAGLYSRGVLNILNGGIDLDTTPLKVMLVTTGYTYDPDHAVVNNAGAAGANLGQNEPAVTGYTAGFGGAGRKTAVVTLTEQTANNRVVTILGNLTWTALGTGATLGACALIREVTNDAASIPIAYLDFTSFPTNGSDVSLSFDATNGNIRWTV